MADWSLPTLSSSYSDLLSGLTSRDSDIAKMFDGTGTNLPSGAIRWSSTNNKFEKYNGTTWSALTAKYLFDVDSVDGCNVDDSAAASTSILWTSNKINTFASDYYTKTQIDTLRSGYLLKNGENGTLTFGTNDNSAVNIEGTLYTDSVRAYNGDWLYVNADNIILNNAVSVGGDGTNGAFYVKDSNGNNVFYVDVPADETGFSGNVTIGGDLNVQGTLNAVNRTEINIEDNTIRLNTGFTGTPSVDAGIIVERGTANDTAIIWNETNDQWTLSNDGNNYYAIARKYVEVIGDASNTAFDVVHNLGTRDVTVMVRENNAEYNVVETDVLMKDGNTVTIGFTDAPALNSYKVIIVG